MLAPSNDAVSYLLVMYGHMNVVLLLVYEHPYQFLYTRLKTCYFFIYFLAFYLIRKVVILNPK